MCCDMSRIDVVAPNLKVRLSGVTSTIIQLVPVQERTLGVATIGPGLPDTLPKIRWWQLPGLLGVPASGRWRIWHARRNVEMVAGLVLRRVFRAPMRLVFTSAGQRAHKPFTKWLIRNMDAVIATSARSGAFLDVPHSVVMHGIDLDLFHPNSDGDDALRTTGIGRSPLDRMFRKDPPSEGHRPFCRCHDFLAAGVWRTGPLSSQGA